MLVIFQILITSSLACKARISERSIYPTLGEYYVMEMNQLFSFGCNSYSCEDCDDNVRIFNSTQLIIENELNQTFKSVKQNESHFAALTDTQLILYELDNVSLESQQAFDLPQNYICFNLIFVNQKEILIDCYLQNQLIFYLFIELNFLNTSNLQSPPPESSQLQLFTNNNEEFILYAQYYQNYSILTLFTYSQNNTMKNISAINYYNFKEFQTSLNFIYLIQNYTTIIQMRINEQYQFMNNQYYFTQREFSSFFVYYSFNSFANCDQLILISNNSQILYKYFGCQSYQQYIFPINLQRILLSQSTKIFGNSDYIFLQDNNLLQILRNNIQFELELLQIILINNNTQFIYNSPSNTLHSFQNTYQKFQIRIPSLVVNQNFFSVNKLTIKLSAYPKQNQKFLPKSKIRINIITLNESDTDIYIQFKSNYVDFLQSDFDILISQNSGFEFYPLQMFSQYFNSYSGQLLKVVTNEILKTPNLKQIQISTYQQLLNQDYQDLDFCSIIYHYPNILFAYVKNNNIFINNCYFNQYQRYICYVYYNYNSEIQIQQFQHAFNQFTFQTNNTYINCLEGIFQFQPNKTIQVFNTGQNFKQYLTTFDGVFVLFFNSSINFYYNCSQSQVITITQSKINKAFNQSENFQFNPLNITTNVQYASSVLFINNQTNIILISITQNTIIPITKFESKNNQSIYGINIVDNRLILSFYQNQQINFEVWNLINIFSPYFEKNLFKIETNNIINLYSDNLYFYVQFNQSKLYIYNPALSQHQALLTNLSFTNSSTMCSSALFFNSQESSNQFITTSSILYLNNSLYQIYPITQIQSTINSSLNNSGYYPHVIYNLTLSSYLNSMSYFEEKAAINLFSFSLAMGGILKTQNENKDQIITIVSNQSQISQCELHNCNYYLDNSQICSQKKVYLINFFQNTTIYQDEGYLYTMQSGCKYQQLLPYNSSNFTQCLNSTTYNNFIFSICVNKTSSYLIQFDLTDFSNLTFVVKNLNLSLEFAKNLQIVNDSIFFQGKQQSEYNFYQLYYFNFIQNQFKVVTDFCQGYIAVSVKLFFQPLFIILYIDKLDVYYIIMDKYLQIQQYNISINLQAFSGNQIILEEIILISLQENYIIALLTNNGAQYLFVQFHFNIEFNFEKAQIIHDFKIIRLLPSIPGYSITQNTVYSNGYLVILYSTFCSNCQELSIYYIGEISSNFENLLIPVLLQKQFRTQPVKESQNIISYQCIYNISQQMLNVVLFTNTNVDNYYQQKILQINPKLQLECNSIQQSVSCCNNFIYLNSCANFQIIDQPDVILNLILSFAVLILLVLCFCRMIEKSELQIELEHTQF